MEEATVKVRGEQTGVFMSDRVLTEGKKAQAENPTAIKKAETGADPCPIQSRGWLKGPLGMAICCGAPLLLIAAVSFFGLSLGAIASGALSLVALLACPVGMFLMMRAIRKD
jgi:hypothetical protein